ncbi:MAG TPA: hypothetical protein VEH04_04125 [Verrucomicrobiae bacterium]|nr:hypothetical protein [Verrucomicrobiae bacterium]
MIPKKKFLQTTAATLIAASVQPLSASENVPHAPFAEWANVPAAGQLVTRLTYQESESYYIWAGNNRHKTDWRHNGEHYGIDINQGYLTFQYGLNDRWAADLSAGYTTAGWRYFNPSGSSESTSGLMDISFGVRYQIFNENDASECPYLPTLTFRAGAVLPGSFDEHFAFAPGSSSTAIEPELLARKHFGWEGFGAYADALFRWNHTSANDQYIVSVGFFQEIQRWELNAGYRHLGSVDGDDVRFNAATRAIDYPRAPRENQDSFEAGFSYRAKRWDTKLGFYTRTVFDGSNTDKKFWLGGFVEIPFQLTSK